jgi:hypothetical protein
MARRFGAALHRKASRFVDDDHVGVFVQNQRADEIDIRAAHAFRRARGGVRQGRHAHFLARLDAVGGFHTRAIDAHLAGADQFLNLTLAQMRVAAAQPAVDPRHAVVTRHFNRFNTAHR